MTIFSCKNINKDFGDQTILKNLSFEVVYGERIGIVGENGAGKSTLIQIVMGQIKADSGVVKWHDDRCTVGYLAQNGHAQLFNTSDWDLDSQYYALESKLNIDLADESALSGGERTKVALAKLWAASPNMLILDEPTNHLDFHGIDWLINEIQYYHGTIIIISHDRYFLDQVSTKILEIEEGQAHDYQGNYSQYVTLKTEKLKTAFNAYQVQEAYKKQIHDDIKNLKAWSGKAHRDSTKKQVAGDGKKEYFRMKAKKKDKQIKSRIKRLEKLDVEGLEKPKTEREIVMHFKTAGNRGKNIIEAKAISKSFGTKNLFQASDFYLTRGERIGLIGSNGCGKTTLLQIILKNLPLDSGEVLMSPTLKLAYMDQYEIQVPPHTTIKDYFDLYDKASCIDLSNRLHQLGFKSLNLDNRVMTLSLGEQTKLKLLKLLLGTYDLIILDEPTNHLDLKSKETFESALSQYNGSLIMVTHDRYLMQKICTGFLVFDKGKIVRHEDMQ